MLDGREIADYIAKNKELSDIEKMTELGYMVREDYEFDNVDADAVIFGLLVFMGTLYDEFDLPEDRDILSEGLSFIRDVFDGEKNIEWDSLDES